MTQEAWFARMSELVTALHDESHHIERFESDNARVVGELFGQVVDVLEHITNSASWDARKLLDFDKSGFAREWDDRVAHRLERE